MSSVFRRTTQLSTDPATAFDVSLSVDFHLDSFARTNESVIGGIRSGAMRLGDDVTWRARHFGIWWSMTSVITSYDRPHSFVDEQKSGPFKSFHHTHEFTENSNGTTMVDVVAFEAPFGVLGRLAERIGLEWYLKRLIDERNAALVRQFRGDAEAGQH